MLIQAADVRRRSALPAAQNGCEPLVSQRPVHRAIRLEAAVRYGRTQLPHDVAVLISSRETNVAMAAEGRRALPRLANSHQAGGRHIKKNRNSQGSADNLEDSLAGMSIETNANHRSRRTLPGRPTPQRRPLPDRHRHLDHAPLIRADCAVLILQFAVEADNQHRRSCTGNLAKKAARYGHLRPALTVNDHKLLPGRFPEQPLVMFDVENGRIKGKRTFGQLQEGRWNGRRRHRSNHYRVTAHSRGGISGGPAGRSTC